MLEDKEGSSTSSTTATANISSAFLFAGTIMRELFRLEDQSRSSSAAGVPPMSSSPSIGQQDRHQEETSFSFDPTTVIMSNTITYGIPISSIVAPSLHPSGRSDGPGRARPTQVIGHLEPNTKKNDRRAGHLLATIESVLEILNMDGDDNEENDDQNEQEGN